MDQLSDALPTKPWSSAKKVFFRAGFLFLTLFIFLYRNEILPPDNAFYGFVTWPMQRLIPWLGKHVLHLPYVVPDLGSFDTTYDYVMLLLITLLTLLGTLVWTLLDRRSTHYKVLYSWLTVLIRYYSAFSMVTYGLCKLYNVQFPFPSPSALLEPFGSFSPMHVAWSFFSYSRTYNFLVGVAEVTAGVLLLFRRTTRVGAILLLVLIGNIMAINYLYDVCLKIVSTALLIMALILLAQEGRRLVDFFFRNKPTAPESDWKPRFRQKWVPRTLVFLKWGLMAGYLLTINIALTGIVKQYGNGGHSPFHGVFNVQTYVKNGDTLAPLLTDTSRWRRLVVTDYGDFAYASVRLMNDSARSFELKVDTLARKLTLRGRADSTKKFIFDYSFTGADSLRLQGNWKGDPVSIFLRKQDLNRLTLISRGFHFINEGPYQR